MTEINHIYKMENFNMKTLKQNKNITIINCKYCGQKSILYNEKRVCNVCQKYIEQRRKYYIIAVIALITFIILLILF